MKHRDPSVPRTSRRRLVTIAISDYDYASSAFKAAIASQVEEVDQWWLNPALGSERVFDLVSPESPVTGRSLHRFTGEQEFENADDDEALVVYITGHGLSPDGCDEHFLLLEDSDESRPLGTALRTTNLLAPILDSHAIHVLVMVDSCFSGVLRSELDRTLKALSEQRRELSSLVVITSGGEKSTPSPGEFAAVLRETRRRFREDESLGILGPYLSVDQFIRVIAQVSNEPGWTEPYANVHLVWPGDSSKARASYQKPNPCLPNPGYVPSRGRGNEGLDPYWLHCASGGSDNNESGWFFTGREDLLRPIARFLHSDTGLMLVTGATGSGKSALLGYAVAFSDRGFREDPANRGHLNAVDGALLPPVGAVNAAARARRLTVDELSEDLLRHFDPPTRNGLGTRASERFLEAVAALVESDGNLVTVVIDGLDEAEDPERVITDLVNPLRSLRQRNGHPGVRLLLGVRSEEGETRETASGLLGKLLDTTVEGQPKLLRTDDRDTAEEHIQEFVLNLLECQWGKDGRLLSRLAEAVAEEVTPSFLDARIAAEQINATPALEDLSDPDSSEWRSELSQGTRQLLRRDVETAARITGVRAQTLVAVLRALAFAEGNGLPWAEVWPRAVEGLSAGSVSAAEATEGIRAVLNGSLSGYLVRAEVDGRRVYGLIHERIAELLRADPGGLLSDPPVPIGWTVEVREAHRRFAVALAGPLWEGEAPHEYTRHFLITHAAKGGVLNDDLIPASFLPKERSGRVRAYLGLLREGTAETRVLTAYAVLEALLDPSASERTRADSLALALSDHPTPLAARDLLPRWRDFVVRGDGLAHEQQSAVLAVATFRTKGGRLMAAAGDDRGRVSVWDVHEGTVVGEPRMIAGGSPVTALAATRHKKGAPWLFTGAKEGLWSHEPGSDRRELLLLDRPVSVIVSESGAGPFLTVGTDSGLVRIDPWISTREIEKRVCRELPGEPVLGLSILEGTAEGQPLLAVARPDRVEVLDADTWEPVARIPIEDGRSFVGMILDTDGRGSPRLTVAWDGGGVGVWDARTGELLVRHDDLDVTALTRYEHPEWGPILGLACADRSVRLWDPARGLTRRLFPVDHREAVTSLAVVTSEPGAPVVVSGSVDSSVRLWNPEAGYRHWDRPAAPGTGLVSYAVGEGRSSLLSLGRGGVLKERSSGEGTSPRDFRTRFDEITAFTTFLDSGTWRLAVGQGDGNVLCGPVRTEGVPGRAVWTPAWPGPEYATAFAVFRSGNGQTRLAVGCVDGSVAYLDPVSGTKSSLRLAGRGLPVTDLVVLPGPRPRLAVADAGGVRVWRPGQEEGVREIPGVGGARALVVHPHEGLVVGGTDGLIRFWSPVTERLTELGQHRGAVAALGLLFRGGDRYDLVSAGADDTTVRVWDVLAGREGRRLVTGMSLASLCVLEEGQESLIVFGGEAGAAAVTLPGAVRG